MKKVILLPVLAGFFFLLVLGVKLFGGNLWGTLLGSGSAPVYKAVFLTNGQVYFGKVGKTDEQTITLTDVFYLKTKEVDQRDPKQATAAAQMELVKPGGEIYGPKDTLVISRRQILVVQDLKDDSPVVKGIQQYYKVATPTPTPTKPGASRGKVEVKSE